MLFIIKSQPAVNTNRLRTNTLLNAYFIIKKYPLKAADILMDRFIKQQYKVSLKDLCIKLLLDLTFYEDDEGNLVLLFKNPKSDSIAQLITYGNGAIQGSKILKTALKL